LYTNQTDAAPCRNLVVHGSEATGKTSVTTQLLARLAQGDGTDNNAANSRAAALVYATVDVARCISARHFFESIIVAVNNAISAWNGAEDNENASQRCETLAQLAASLSSIFDQPRTKDGLKHFVLVLDGMDKQRDAPPTLMPALARLGETVSWNSSSNENDAAWGTATNKKPADFMPHVRFYRYDSSGWISSGLSNFVPLLPSI
jgi:origin recognition complex subunit 5